MEKRVPLETTNPEPAPAPPPEPAEATPAAPAVELTFDQIEEIKLKITEALKTCYDPEIPVNIFELGLVYDIILEPTGIVLVRMTLTSPACPAAGTLPPEVQAKVRSVPGVANAKVEVVWDPPWNQSKMSEEAKLQLGIFDY